MSESLDYGALLARWDDMSMADTWLLESGDLRNIIDVATETIERLQTRIDAAAALADEWERIGSLHDQTVALAFIRALRGDEK